MLKYFLHIGLETVAMNGEGFEVLVKVGDKIKVGQDLLRFDLKKIDEKADSEISAFLISNSDEFEKININVEKIMKKRKIGGMHNKINMYTLINFIKKYNRSIRRNVNTFFFE